MGARGIRENARIQARCPSAWQAIQPGNGIETTKITKITKGTEKSRTAEPEFSSQGFSILEMTHFLLSSPFS
jgi:hypothetical protein